MSDLLLDLSKNPQARKLVKTLGLPIPMPQVLARPRGPWVERPLADANVIVGGVADTALTRVLAHTIAEAGGNAHVVADEATLARFRQPGEAWARPAKAFSLAEVSDSFRAQVMIFDATRIQGPEHLRELYDFFHPVIGALAKSGRALVLARPIDADTEVATAAAINALDGFTRSLAKEVGKVGATAQLIYVAEGAEDRLPPVLRFFLADRSAFITGQPITLTSKVRSEGPYPAVRPLHGKVALVTGAARGIGAATAELLAAEGAHVVCLDRPADDGPLSQVARSIKGSVLLCDITDSEAPNAINSYLRDQHGGVDIVIHNAGITRDKTIRKMSSELWDQAIDVNLGAVVRITAALLTSKQGAMRDGGRIVCLSSVAGIAGNMGQTNYAASKAGIVGFVRQLAPQVAPRGIAVNAVAPGFIETRLTNAMPAMIREGARRMSALGQGGQPEDVGEALVFLSSPGAAGITGSVLRVCGGALVGA